jgi:hypothetical protein
MLSEIRPDFEVVKEGRILYFVSGDRKFIRRIRLLVDLLDHAYFSYFSQTLIKIKTTIYDTY